MPILLTVDDSRDVRTAVSRSLRDLGYEVRRVGHAPMVPARTRRTQECPSLVR